MTEQRDPLSHRNPSAVAAVMPVLKRLMRAWFRSEVRGIERVPEGGALIVSNHSGGLTPMDVPILGYALVDHFGSERPFYVLAHDMLFTGVAGPVMRAMGFLPASRENARALLSAGAVTILFPGGDYDSFRPSTRRNTIDFAGRTGYVRTALEAGVPIVPAWASAARRPSSTSRAGSGSGAARHCAASSAPSRRRSSSASRSG